jgi:hypothetical protein
MASVDTRLVLDNKQTTYYGKAVTDPSLGTITIDILAGKSYTVQTRFSVPRSATAGVGSTVNNITVAYTINTGSLTSASSLLNRITQQNAVAPSLSVNLLGAPTTAFGLVVGSFRAVIPVAVPAIDNQANTLTIAYLITTTFTASTDVNISFSNAEVNYSYVAISSTPSFANIALTDVTNQILFGTGNTTRLNVTAPAANRIVTLADAGADSGIVLTAGAQTIGGAKSFTSSVLTDGITTITGGGNLSLSTSGGGSVSANCNISLSGNQLTSCATVTRDGANLTIQTTTSGDVVLTPAAGSVVRTSRQIVSDNTTATTSNATGAIITAGGISSSNVTDGGSLTVGGGAAIAKKCYIGTGLYLPTTGGVQTELNYYSENSTAFVFGPGPNTATISSTFKLRRIGKMVIAEYASATGTGATAAAALISTTNLSAEYRPTVLLQFIVRIRDNGTDLAGSLRVDTAGQMTFYRDVASNSYTANAGANGFLANAVSWTT